jgi:hypothetical protein
MIDELNKEAFELIKFIIENPINVSNKKTDLVGSFKEREINDWSLKTIGGKVVRTTDHLEKTTEIYFVNENSSIGFNKLLYLRFNTLVQKFYSIEGLYQKVSLYFIENELFRWIIDVYLNQKAPTNLYEFLLCKADLVVKPHTFYFPILNLEIEKQFNIGIVEFTYFTKDYFDNLFQKLKAKDDTYTDEIFNEIFRKDFQGQVLAKVTVTAERQKAEEIAKQNSEIAVDVLKLYSETTYIPEKKTTFDLNYRLSYQVQTNFLSENPNESKSLALSVKFNNHPFYVSHGYYESVSQCGLKMFSEYISQSKSDELREIIIQSIHLFGSAISNWDLHLRCVSFITILESILLKEDETKNLEHKTLARLSKALTNQHQEKERLKAIFSNIYQVRHKMIHKARRIEIDTKELSEVQKNMVSLFLRLIQLNSESGFRDKTTLIDELNKINS